MKTNSIINKIVGLMVVVTLSSCMSEWLDAKPNKSLVIPHTIKDYQALLDNSLVMNYEATSSLIEVMADDFYVTDEQWIGYTRTRNKNAYLWQKDIFEGEDDLSWNGPYQKIYYANTVIDGIKEIEPEKNNIADWNNILGSALFYRGENFFNLVEMFSDVYDPATAANVLGLPLKLESDINIAHDRSSLEQTYERILEDVTQASRLLPDVAEIPTRPSREAAFGLLARVYLQIGDFERARNYADSCLMIGSQLLDFNLLNIDADFPFERHNDEVVFSSSMQRDLMLINMAHIDSGLYDSYHEDDLRKIALFTEKDGQIVFRGSYEGETTMFSGIARGEIYLIRAECNARLGNSSAALSDLQALLVNRYRKGAVTEPIDNMRGDGLLRRVLLERRKELVFRGRRWSDLRRLNQDPRFAVQQKRVIGGQEYILPPNDPRYSFPIPDNVIRLSGIEQNPR